MNIQQREENFSLGIYASRGISLVRGKDASLWDDKGKEYIDCASGIGVANIGHANPALASAIATQAKKLVTCPGIFFNEQRGLLMEKLVDLAPEGLNRVFLCNSGTESIEAAIKFARKTTKRNGIVSAMRGFHGRTMGALSATFKYRDSFEPLLTNCKFVPFNKLEKLVDAVSEDTAVVILEVIQGEGGVRPANSEYLLLARRLCDEYNAILIIDEVQTGFCRTGTFFACEATKLMPDILCLAKGIAGGMPMGAVLCSKKINADIGDHGSTFGGNPLACAAAIASINFMQENNLAEKAFKRGEYFKSHFMENIPQVVIDLRQIGLMIGIELKEKAKPHLEKLLKNGVIALPAGPTVIRLLPPLVISEAQLDIVIEALFETLSS